MATDSRLNNSESHNLQILWTICHNSSKQRILWSFNIFEVSKYILYNTVKVLKKKKNWLNSEIDLLSTWINFLMANVISNNNPRLYHLNKQSSKQMCVAYIFDFLATKLSAGKWTMGI